MRKALCLDAATQADVCGFLVRVAGSAVGRLSCAACGRDHRQSWPTGIDVLPSRQVRPSSPGIVPMAAPWRNRQESPAGANMRTLRRQFRQVPQVDAHCLRVAFPWRRRIIPISIPRAARPATSRLCTFKMMLSVESTIACTPVERIPPRSHRRRPSGATR